MKNLVILIILTFSFRVYGHHKIYSPRVEEGRQSLEWRGHLDIDDTIEKTNHTIMCLKLNIPGQVSGKVS